MKKLSELSLPELKKRQSVLKGVVIGFAILMLSAICILVYLKAKPVLFIPVFVLPIIWMPILFMANAINQQIKKQESGSN